MNQTIDITKLKSTELKAMIYDRIVMINRINEENKLLNDQLTKTLETENIPRQEESKKK